MRFEELSNEILAEQEKTKNAIKAQRTELQAQQAEFELRIYAIDEFSRSITDFMGVTKATLMKMVD